MALTFLKLKNHAQLEGNVSSAFDVGEIVNEAGAYLFDMHPWNCLVAPPITLDFLASRNYVELPANFGKVIEIVPTSGLTSSFSFTSMQNLTNYRSESVTQIAQHYFAAISYPSQEDRTKPPPPPRLELWPTPSSESRGVLTIVYRKRWRVLVDNTDVPDMDESLNPLLRLVVRAFVLGYEEEDAGSLDERLAVIESGSILQRLKENDGLRQSDAGVLIGGLLAEYPRWNDYGWRVNASASDPS